MNNKKCFVKSCKERSSTSHRFPTIFAVREIWLSRIGNEEISEENFHHKRVCHNHFASCCFQSNGKLKKYSLPTINLPNFKEASTEQNSFLNLRKNKKNEKSLDQIEIDVFKNATEVTEDENLILIKPNKTYARRCKRTFTVAFSNDESRPTNVFCENPNQHLNNEQTEILNNGPKLKKGKIYAVNPEVKKLRRQVKNLRTTNTQLRNNIKFLKSKPNFLNSLKNVNPATQKFILNQIRNQKVKPRGRRYTIDDKIMALSIMKQSGKGYGGLSYKFSLPTRRTLNFVLKKIPVITGINLSMFEQLKDTVSKMNFRDKHCVLMFDEIALEPGFQYNFAKDCIDGFVDLGGSDRRPKFADHALVFLLRGICKKWKQPICFTFAEATTATADIVRLLKEVIKHVRQAGLEIVASISDQGATNAAAIRQLIKERNAYCIRGNIENKFQGYLVDGIEVVHLYDTPHLLKGIRNSLLKSDLHFVQEGVEKVASWSHLLDLYRIDQSLGRFSEIHKLTDEHVLPSRIRKMKVKNCSQVFSHSVATAMNARAQTSTELQSSSQFFLNPKASDTAELFLFLDELFDSVNGSMLRGPPGKLLRCAVTDKSKHVVFWTNAITILRSMYFENSASLGNRRIPPSLSNWIFTLQGFLYIWNTLKNKNFKFMIPRIFNQDPVENYFSCIRRHGVRNTKPNCSAFITSSKTLLVNNMSSPHSVGANCEKDESDGILDCLKNFIQKNDNAIVELPIVTPPILPSVAVNFQNFSEFKHDFSNAYVAGVVAKKILKKFSCEDCIKEMQASTLDNLSQNFLISQRQYVNCKLINPSSKFSRAFRHIANLIHFYFLKHCTCYGLRKIIYNEILNCEDISYLFCENHKDLAKDFINISINITLFHHLKKINNILSGKDQRFKDEDSLTKMAFEKYSKRLRIPRR